MTAPGVVVVPLESSVQQDIPPLTMVLVVCPPSFVHEGYVDLDRDGELWLAHELEPHMQSPRGQIVLVLGRVL